MAYNSKYSNNSFDTLIQMVLESETYNSIKMAIITIDFFVFGKAGDRKATESTSLDLYEMAMIRTNVFNIRATNAIKHLCITKYGEWYKGMVKGYSVNLGRLGGFRLHPSLIPSDGSVLHQKGIVVPNSQGGEVPVQ